jgi:2',3'-cyclic-nucleotide 2'-phosphodiesterase (5'-nucleotidase family)
MEADIGFANGGGIRTDIPEGDLTYEQLLNVYPFNNEICVLEITGQQIIDALEWGVRSEPDENGGFLQVSGLTYEIDVNVPTPCKTNKSGAFSGIEGKRRVRNVKVGDAPIDPDAYYKVAGNTYMMQEGGEGFTMFKDPKTIINNGKLDSEVIIEYIRDHLNGEIGTGYTDPHGEGRITVIQ